MIITGTMDAAARAEKIGRHKLTGVRLTAARVNAVIRSGNYDGRSRSVQGVVVAALAAAPADSLGG
jgi:hypothetical protein